jgi:hypothetical protein
MFGAVHYDFRCLSLGLLKVPCPHVSFVKVRGRVAQNNLLFCCHFLSFRSNCFLRHLIMNFTVVRVVGCGGLCYFFFFRQILGLRNFLWHRIRPCFTIEVCLKYLLSHLHYSYHCLTSQYSNF